MGGGSPKPPPPVKMPQTPTTFGAEENAKNAERIRRLFATGRQSTMFAGWGSTGSGRTKLGQ